MNIRKLERIIEDTLDICCKLLDIDVSWDFAEGDELDILTPATFFKDDNIIIINPKKMNNINEIYFLLAHECRHAWQFKTGYHLEEFDHYVHPIVDKEKYLEQKIEIDADAFGLYVNYSVLKIGLDMPAQHMENVKKRLEEIAPFINENAKKILEDTK